MYKLLTVLFSFCSSDLSASLALPNSTYPNPILPGFHPDPSCIFVPEWNNTFFCASSSFEAFPGIPIPASKDLQNWKLVSNALNRPEQLPTLAMTNKSTSGIWAPVLRYHEGTFYILTSLVFDDQDAFNASRWDNMIFTSKDPTNSASWSDPVHFNFTGYDTSPFWDDDGTVYVTGSHLYHVQPGINQATINLETGEVGQNLINIWNGTGGLAPEDPHVYKREDGYYYLMIAEGGTGLNHMETIARSRNINGPNEADPANPVLTNAKTSAYFQTVGHADIFQDGTGNYWGVALSTRSGPNFTVFPMGRETLLTPVTWEDGQFPIFTKVSGVESGWHFPEPSFDIGGEGAFIKAPDDLEFPPNNKLPCTSYTGGSRLQTRTSSHLLTARTRCNSRLQDSILTGYDGNYVGPEGHTFVGRRQTDTLFTFEIDMEFSPQKEEEEFRFRAASYLAVPDPYMVPVPEAWDDKKLTMQIKAFNTTHYTFSAGPADAAYEMTTIALGEGSWLSFGFTGTLVGVYATTNGAEVDEKSSKSYVSRWRYWPQGQVQGWR